MEIDILALLAIIRKQYNSGTDIRGDFLPSRVWGQVLRPPDYLGKVNLSALFPEGKLPSFSEKLSFYFTSDEYEISQPTPPICSWGNNIGRKDKFIAHIEHPKSMAAIGE